jgi:hypothetical protein
LGRRPGETGAFQPQGPPGLAAARQRGDDAASWLGVGAEIRHQRQIHHVQDGYSERGHDEGVVYHEQHQHQHQPLALRGATVPGNDMVSTGKHDDVANSAVPDPHAHVPGEVCHFSRGSLTDPVFQDLDRSSRYYLAHCKSPSSRFVVILLHHTNATLDNWAALSVLVFLCFLHPVLFLSCNTKQDLALLDQAGRPEAKPEKC